MVIQRYTEVRLDPSQYTEGAFRAGICCWLNQKNIDQGHVIWSEGLDIFVLFEEISDIMQCITHWGGEGGGRGGLYLKPPKFEHIFVAIITFFPFLLCRYFRYQLVAYCVWFKMICKKSL